MTVGGGPPDLNVVKEGLFGSVILPGNSATRGMSPISPRLIPGQRTRVYGIGGQSRTANYVDAFYTPASPLVQMLSIYDGAIYPCIDPVLGASGTDGSYIGRIGDELRAIDYLDRPIFIPFAIGGTTASQWIPGGDHHDRMLHVCRRAAAAGLTIDAFLWGQGNNDNEIGTTEADYAAMLAQIIATPRSIGVNAPWLIALDTRLIAGTSAAVRAALAAAPNGHDIFAGPDLDSLTGANLQPDLIHFTGAGAAAAAVLWRDAIIAALPSS
jgi:hypothetical protein